MNRFVKLILTKNAKTPDVRYVELKEMGIPQILHLRRSIISAFSIAPETEFKITWIDSDGDHIEVSTDDDLKIAFLKMEVPVFHVSCDPKNNVTFEEQTENLATRILCDVCEKQVNGFRYKCLECADYDLCSTCENAGHHADHIFLRLPNSDFPLSRADRRILFSAARELKKTAYHACRKAHRVGRDFWKSASSSSQSKDAKGEKGCKSDTAFGSDCPAGGCPYPADFNLDEMSKVASILRDHVQPIVGAAVAEPYLISDTIRNIMEAVFGGAARNETAPEGNNQAAASTSQATATTTTSTTTANNGNSAPNVVSSEKEKPATNPENTEMDWTLINSSQVPPATSIANTVSSASSVASEANTTPQLNSSAPPPEPGFILHPDPVIARGLSQLYEMGFSNENDILTSLLRRYNGNVSEVVKTIVNMK